MSEPVIIDLFEGAGGWSEAARMLGLGPVLGLELDKDACDTSRAAGGTVTRCDITRFPSGCLAGNVAALAASPPCTLFSAAGTGVGVTILDELAAMIRDALAGGKTMAAHRRVMAAKLAAAGWPDWKAPRSPGSARMGRKGKRRGKRAAVKTAGRGNAIQVAVRNASLVAEPARFIAACRPEWVALEQVPEVLPLWRVYAAELRKMGYSAWCGKLNAADYGVPQTRIRAILIASRARAVTRPMPTHYDPKRGAQLWGEPWVSMSAALGWGMTGRPYFALATAGGNRGGADEQVGGSRAREALYAERDAGRWVLEPAGRAKVNDRTRPRGLDEPATTIAFGHSGMVWTNHAGMPETDRQWMLSRDRGAGLASLGGDHHDRAMNVAVPAMRERHPAAASRTHSQHGDWREIPRSGHARCGSGAGFADGIVRSRRGVRKTP